MKCCSFGMQLMNGLSSRVGFEREILSTLGMKIIVWTIERTPLMKCIFSAAASEEFLELVKSSLLAALEGLLFNRLPVN
jgi:hypothetical protein